MSHRDSVAQPPDGAHVIASSPSTPIAAFEDPARRIYGVQFHPEVVHTPSGMEMLKNFLYQVAEAPSTWTAAAVIEEETARISARVGHERVLCALSGGVDSAVAALLVHKAVGDQLTCVFVDHGLLRSGEATQVVETFERHFQVPLVHVDAQEQFPWPAFGNHRPGAETETDRRGGSSGYSSGSPSVSVRSASWSKGTLYSDVIESGGSPARPRRNDQVAPQRWRAPRRDGARARRAAAHAVQG